MSGKQIVAILVVLVLAYAAYDSFFTVTPRERVVLVQMGKIIGENYPPGLHFKIPFIQQVHAFDRRTMTLTGQIKRVLTSENKNLAVDYYVKWRIVQTVKYYLATHGSEDRATSLLTESVQNALLAEFSKRTINQAIGDRRSQIVAAVKVQANQAAQSLGVHITDVGIMKLNLPEKVSESVYQRMRSKRQEVIRTLHAQGDAAAQAIRSDAQRERTVILANAYKQAQTLKGQGDAKAAKIYADAYQKNPNFYSFYRSLEVYRADIGKNDLLLLKPGGALFKYFNPKTIGAKSAGPKRQHNSGQPAP